MAQYNKGIKVGNIVRIYINIYLHLYYNSCVARFYPSCLMYLGYNSIYPCTKIRNVKEKHSKIKQKASAPSDGEL